MKRAITSKIKIYIKPMLLALKKRDAYSRKHPYPAADSFHIFRNFRML